MTGETRCSPAVHGRWPSGSGVAACALPGSRKTCRLDQGRVTPDSAARDPFPSKRFPLARPHRLERRFTLDSGSKLV